MYRIRPPTEEEYLEFIVSSLYDKLMQKAAAQEWTTAEIYFADHRDGSRTVFAKQFWAGKFGNRDYQIVCAANSRGLFSFLSPDTWDIIQNTDYCRPVFGSDGVLIAGWNK